jgi:hypothetical protein
MSSRICSAVQRTRYLSLPPFHSSDQSFLSLLVEDKRFRVKKKMRAAEFDPVKVSRCYRARPKTGQAPAGVHVGYFPVRRSRTRFS